MLCLNNPIICIVPQRFSLPSQYPAWFGYDLNAINNTSLVKQNTRKFVRYLAFWDYPGDTFGRVALLGYFYRYDGAIPSAILNAIRKASLIY